MKTVYILYIRSILEQSAVIWHRSLTDENRTDLERVQKNALRNTLKHEYTGSKSALKKLKLESLEKRREKLINSYGKQCLKLKQTKELFPKHKTDHNMNTRQKQKYYQTPCKTERLKKLTVHKKKEATLF